MKLFLLLTIFFIINHARTGKSQEVSLVELTAENFAAEIETQPHFVMFYAPWCGHCKRLHPTWNDLGQSFKDVEGAPVLAKVDCTKHTSLCAEHDVNGYPTIKLFEKGSTEAAKYKGSRELETLKKYVVKKLEISEKDEPPTVEKVFEHTDDTFEKFTKKGNHFIKFYAPWCGHCQRLAPTWQTLHDTFKDNADVTISKLDCTQYKDICIKYEVKGYPTLLWLIDGVKSFKYSGDRSLEDLQRFVLEQKKSDEVEPEKVVPPALPVISLAADQFEETISKGLVLVKFYAPWCGHCKRMSPTYDLLGEKFADIPAVTIAKVDCTEEDNIHLCSSQEINGFPTLILFKDGVKTKEYSGDRSLDDLANFIASYISHEEL